MSPVVKKILWVLVIVVLLVVVVVACGAWLLFKRPLKLDALISRSQLGKAGLVEHRVDGPDGPIMVFEGGSGATMVLLHGAGDQAGAWAKVAPKLAEHYRLLIPDQPGHWKSPPLNGPIHPSQILAGLEAVMDARCADERAILVGNSMGAWMAMLYAREHPERVERIVAINGGAITNLDTEVNVFPKTREEARETMRALLGLSSPMPPGFVLDDVVRHARVGPAARFVETVSEWGPFLLDDRLHEVMVPVELVWGESDGLMTPDYARRLRDGLPRARLVFVEDCGHIPMRECPYRLQGVILRALEQPPVDAEPEIEPTGEKP